ncbi:endolysin [Arthrobacter phage KBurrousTX]|uniref:Endolysin n=1 Tax=Arthrobacter phage KBurrousTX TaxID=2315608 RepID=A0A386KBD2_9CAUD|nr:endolysin [Arthrobacter phage KBurrousTX]AYD81566.1 endolysin [Arthrobacter phage KBurrousTX]
MTKRQFLVTVEDSEQSDDMVGTLMRGVLDGHVIVERLADKVAGIPAHWDANAPRGQVTLVQNPPEQFTGENYGPTPEQWDMLRDRVKSMILGRPYGHVEVVQDDGTSRRPEPGEILTIDGLQQGFNYPERFSVGTADGATVGRFRTREQADKAAERWNQQDTVNEVYPATVRDLREETTNED